MTLRRECARVRPADAERCKMNKINWWAIASVVLLGALILTGASSLLGSGWWGSSRGMGMMGPGTNGNGWIWQIAFLPFRCLMPALFITLLVLGIVWLVKAVSASPGLGIGGLAAVPPCAECGRPVQAGWQVCPYCGHKLS